MLATLLLLFIYIYIYIYIEHSIWDESSLFSNCTCSLEYSSLSTLAGLSYHICGKLEVAFKASPSSQHQHCTDEALTAETVLSAVSYIYTYIHIYHLVCTAADKVLNGRTRALIKSR